MAEGAKMEGASQGTAQQRPLAEEGVGKKKAAQLLKWLTYHFNAGAGKKQIRREHRTARREGGG